MCEELNEQLKEGQELAQKLIKHLDSMGAQQCEMPITTDNGCYIVKVIKTL